MISNAWLQRGFLFCAASLWLGYAMADQTAGAPQAPPSAAYQGSQGYRPQGQPAANPRQVQPRYQLAERTNPVPDPTRISLDRRPGEHPLMPALRWANTGLRQMEENLHDYSSIVVKRERIDGELSEEQWMLVKIRHKPFSVYMRFLKPKNLEGQEVIYVAGANDGKMLAHGVGMRSVFGTVRLKPTSAVAMQGQHYPITDMGVKNLIQRLLEVGNDDIRYGECEVKFLQGAKINERICTCIEVMHPKPRTNFRFHLARIYVDNEMNMPIRYESHDWPKQPGGPPELIEEYTYLNIQVNNGFTDADFDIRNPNYGFREAGR